MCEHKSILQKSKEYFYEVKQYEKKIPKYIYIPLFLNE